MKQPKEKAEELINKFIPPTRGFTPEMGHFDCINQAKQCAIIAVKTHIYSENDSPFATIAEWREDDIYWQQVKDEINKL